VEERIGLVFSWDPRGQHWVKERGPDDAPPPPADPIDNGAVQTYFLDPQTGRWNGTILGLKGRQISVELANRYRTPKMVGLAIIAKAAPKHTVVQTPDQKKSNTVPMMAGLAAVVVVIAAGAFAAQAVMKPKDGTVVDPVATAPGAVASLPVGAKPTLAASAPVSSAPTVTAPPPTVAPTAAPSQAPVRTAAPTVAPTAPPPVSQTVTYSARLPNGTTVVYRGPNAVNQGATLDGVISVNVAGGAGGTEPLTLYIGPLGTAQSAKFVPDRNGNIAFAIRVSAPKGPGQLSFSLGANGELRILGAITVR
jgi:hypothetical protein